jgi:hypothetical protein
MKLKDLLEKEKTDKKSNSKNFFKEKRWDKSKVKTPIDPAFDTKQYENEKENMP